MSAERATLVLVHGAWHGSWCWERVAPLIEREGIAVAMVDLPSVRPRNASAGLADDAVAVRELIDRLAGPVVLCGHSYGGMVISRAAAAHSRVAALVYLCAFVPQPGESLVAASGNRNASWIRLLEDGTTLPDRAQAADAFYGDCDPETASWALERLAPQNAVAFNEPVAQPAWLAIPSTYIVCAQDRAVLPEIQRTVFAPRARHVLELATSHSPFLSQPKLLAETLAAVIAQRSGA
jgi:pimeloyl-ACP methyl ester carboxylesterase